MTTDTYAPAVTTYAPPTPLTWQALTLANPSLLSWERSAAAAGAKQLGWWCRWASDSRILRADISHAIGQEASSEVFWSAMGIVQGKLREGYQAGVTARQQAEEREAVAARQQARATPPPPRPWGRRSQP